MEVYHWLRYLEVFESIVVSVMMHKYLLVNASKTLLGLSTVSLLQFLHCCLLIRETFNRTCLLQPIYLFCQESYSDFYWISNLDLRSLLICQFSNTCNLWVCFSSFLSLPVIISLTSIISSRLHLFKVTASNRHNINYNNSHAPTRIKVLNWKALAWSYPCQSDSSLFATSSVWWDPTSLMTQS